VGNIAWGVLPASAAAPKTYTLGVDNAAPSGHDWLYVDFFPRQGVRIHRGDVINFNWNTGSIDGAHTVALPPLSTPTATLPFAVPDVDPVPDPGDGPNQQQFNPAVVAPTNPTCGTETNPCDFNGASRLTSGLAFNAQGNHFYVKMDVPVTNSPVTVNFFCEIHPGMQGSIQVVPNGTTASNGDQVANAATVQYQADTRGALEAEAAVESSAVHRDASGGKTITVTAGTATPFVEVVEMLPRKVDIVAGDKIKWVTQTIRDVHTVTFPQGEGSDPVDPLQNVCDPGDTPAASPASCTNPFLFETHLNAQPQGAQVITSPKTVGTSGIIANPPAPFPNNFTFSFPDHGVFTYQCRIHDHMTGTVVVT
jgi:plastocyanin